MSKLKELLERLSIAESSSKERGICDALKDAIDGNFETVLNSRSFKNYKREFDMALKTWSSNIALVEKEAQKTGDWSSLDYHNTGRIKVGDVLYKAGVGNKKKIDDLLRDIESDIIYLLDK